MSVLGYITFGLQSSYEQIENWQTYVDPEKRFTLFYPLGWTAKGKENFLSSTDLTLTNPNSTRLKITITYIINDSSLNYTGNQIIVPENNLVNIEEQFMPIYQQYSIISKDSSRYNVYGFPTASDVANYIKHNGETGRVLNILGIIKGTNSFLFTYSNSIQAYYKYLQTIGEIIKSIIILK